MLAEPKLVPAAAFYILYILGLLVFAITPALCAQSLLMAASMGAFLGLIAYASYDLINLATLKGWPISLPWLILHGVYWSVRYQVQQLI